MSLQVFHKHIITDTHTWPCLKLPTFYKQSKRGSGPNQKWNKCVDIEINVWTLKKNCKSLISVLNFYLCPFPFTLIVKTLLWHESDIIRLKWLHLQLHCVDTNISVFLSHWNMSGLSAFAFNRFLEQKQRE